MDIALLLTGNELMSGDTIDSNSALLAQQLADQGFNVAHKVTIGDSLPLLVREMRALAERYAAVIVNGGLGPTIDDLTAEALAELVGEPLVEHPDAREHIVKWCGERGVQANAANLKQALLPASASIIANPVGSAVGIRCDLEGSEIFCTPGVPSELRAMLEGDLTAQLSARFPGAKAPLIRRLRLFGIGESSLQQLLEDSFPDWPDAVTVGFRAGAPLLELKLQVMAESDLALRDECERQLTAAISEYLVGYDDDTLATALVDTLRDQGKVVALAESCTGGQIAAQITALPGASEVFHAGIVAYANPIKQRVLGVDADVLDQRGAVSEETVLAMARGALAQSGSDCAIAVSGIAGPDGGTDEKPVGTVWVAWGDRDAMLAHRFFYPVGRSLFQTMISAVAMDLMRRFLEGSRDVPGYFQRDRR